MPKQWSTPPAMQIDPKKKYRAHMETDNGTMVIELFADKAPVTVIVVQRIVPRRTIVPHGDRAGLPLYAALEFVAHTY